MTERTLEEMESLWLLHLLGHEQAPPDDARMLELQLQAWSWAYQSLHGRGTPPPERLWLRLAQLMGWGGSGVLAAFKPLPDDAAEQLARFG